MKESIQSSCPPNSSFSFFFTIRQHQVTFPCFCCLFPSVQSLFAQHWIKHFTFCTLTRSVGTRFFIIYIYICYMVLFLPQQFHLQLSIFCLLVVLDNCPQELFSWIPCPLVSASWVFLMMPHFGFSISQSLLTHTTTSFGLGGALLLCLFIKGWGPLVASSVDSICTPSSSIMSTLGVKDNVGCFAILVVGKVHFLAAPQLNFCLYFSHCFAVYVHKCHNDGDPN